MIYLLQWYWGWLLLALILGWVVGFYAVEREFKPENRLWWLPVRSRWILAIFVFGCIVAIMDWFPGRLAFYLDTALLFFAFYIIGCLLGGASPEMLDRWKAARAKASQAATGTSATQGKTAAVPPAHAPIIIPDAPTGPILPVDIPAAPLPPSDKPSSTQSSSAQTPESRSVGDTTIDYPGKMPPAAEPRPNALDDLKRITGVGPVDEQRLHDLGVWHFAQIAAWTPENAQWVGSYLASPGRIKRERWVEQARDLIRESGASET